MIRPTVKQFIELLQRSKLVDDDLLKEKLLECKRQRGEFFATDVDAVVDFLVATKVVSRWQCEKLLSGKYKGFMLGKYKLLDHLGTGGMSSVYLAEHVVMRRKAAIKVLPKRRQKDESYRARFELEAQAFGRLDHPNIVRAYDVNNDGDSHYLVMEYVPGKDLQAIIKEDGVLSYEQAAGFIVQAAIGLQHAHDNGLVHRDVKPSNLLVDSQGVIKILDLGLALMADEEQASLTMQFNENVLGTADYLAPEQALNSHNVDARVDIYGLGGTLYFALTGHAPFPVGTVAQRIAKHQSQMPADIRVDRPDCPQELVDICVRMMQKNPDDRFANCAEVADTLLQWLVARSHSSLSNDVAVEVGQRDVGAVQGVPVRKSVPVRTTALKPTSGNTISDSSIAMALDAVRIRRELSLPKNATEVTKINRATEDTVPDRGNVPLGADNFSNRFPPAPAGIWAEPSPRSATAYPSESAAEIAHSFNSRLPIVTSVARSTSGTCQCRASRYLGMVGLGVGLVAAALALAFSL